MKLSRIVIQSTPADRYATIVFEAISVALAHRCDVEFGNRDRYLLEWRLIERIVADCTPIQETE